MKLTTMQVYDQLYRIGPRRSGRSVGNLTAAVMGKSYHGSATVVVPHEMLVDNAKRELRDTLKVPEHAQPKIVTLNNVTAYRGPFYPDHYTTERIIGEYHREIDKRDDEIYRLNRQLQELTGAFANVD